MPPGSQLREGERDRSLQIKAPKRYRTQQKQTKQ